MKKCLYCGKELNKGKSKYCDNICQKGYRKLHPRYTKECIYCGKEFRTNKSKKKLCGVECKNAYEKYRRMTESKNEFKEKLEKKHKGFIYLSGYEHYMSNILMKCEKCGNTIERTAQIAKPTYKSEIVCEVCVEMRILRRDLINTLIKRMDALNVEQRNLLKAKQEKKRLESLKNRECLECGKLYTAISVKQKYCSKECGDRKNNRIKDIRKRDRIIQNGKVDWDITLEKLIKRDKNICHICKEKCNSEDYVLDKQGNFIVGKEYPSIDHLIPISKGGKHNWRNVKLAHHYCNTIKNNNDLYETETGQLKISI